MHALCLSRLSDPTPARTGARHVWMTARVLAAVLACAGMEPAAAGAILVGSDPEACTKPSIQEAIDWVNDEIGAGYSLVVVTDDVADGVYHENLDVDMDDGVSLEIVGGYRSCSDLTPTGGKASIYGGGDDAPVMQVRGQAEVVLRNLWMEGGVEGIDWEGRGRIVLHDTTINNNRDIGVRVEGHDGTARLELLGGNVISHNSNGVRLASAVYESESNGSAMFVRGPDNRIVQNRGFGIEVLPGGYFDADGILVSENAWDGIFLDIWRGTAPHVSLLYSSNPDAPATIELNGGRGISFSAAARPHRFCTRNVAIHANRDGAIRAAGAHADLEMNGATCEFPPEADVRCPTPAASGQCNTITGHDARADRPLIAAVDGARIDLNRMLIFGNVASSVLSTNLGTATSDSSITMSTSVVIDNVLRDNLFEALNDGVVDVWESTVSRNQGGFSYSFLGIDPALLQATNSVIDQPQTLVRRESGDPANTRLTRVLASNIDGTTTGDEVLLGTPRFQDPLGRLEPDSPGIDYAPAGGGTDLDGRPRDIDAVMVADVHGPRDLGAFESQVRETALFEDGFEHPSPSR